MSDTATQHPVILNVSGIRLSERAYNYLRAHHDADTTTVQQAIEKLIESRAAVYDLTGEASPNI